MSPNTTVLRGVIGITEPMSTEAYYNELLNAINIMRLSINSNALGTGDDLPYPANLKARALEVANATIELYGLMPAFTEKVLVLALGSQFKELIAILKPRSGDTPQPKIDCKLLQQDINKAADEGLGITTAMQAQFRRVCPNLVFPPRR